MIVQSDSSIVSRDAGGGGNSSTAIHRRAGAFQGAIARHAD